VIWRSRRGSCQPKRLPIVTGGVTVLAPVSGMNLPEGCTDSGAGGGG
jgi:hypothetical protein